jgi:hypothetical protein
MRPSCGTTPTIVEALRRYATQHPDPEHDGCLLQDDCKDRLDTEAINTVRGWAAEAIASVLFEKPALLTDFESAIVRLVVDRVACIRTAAIAALRPILNVNRDRAVDLFLQSVSNTTERVLQTRNVRRFLRQIITSHGVQLNELISRMASSTLPDVAEAGAVWATLTRLLTGACGVTFEQCLAGSGAQRRGVAQALAHNLDDERIAPKCRELLPQFFEDEDRKVRDAAAIVVRRDTDWSNKTNAELLHKHFSSRAFLDAPRTALWWLESFGGDLVPLAEPIFAACENATQGMAERLSDGGPDFTSALEKLSVLLLRLYGQTRETDSIIRRRCLDSWDSILQRSGWLSPTILQNLDE